MEPITCFRVLEERTNSYLTDMVVLLYMRVRSIRRFSTLSRRQKLLMKQNVFCFGSALQQRMRDSWGERLN